MAIPFASAIVGGGGATLLDYALGRPLNLWGRSIDAVQAPTVRNSSYRGNLSKPNVLPAPDAIIEAFRRGMIERSGAKWALEAQGVAFDQFSGATSAGVWRDAQWYSEIWEQVGKMRRSRPEPSAIARAWISGRIGDQEYGQWQNGYDCDWSSMERALWLQYQSPGINELLQLRRLERISQADFDQGCRLLGWVNSQQVERQAMVTPLPDMGTLMRDYLLGLITQNEYNRYMNAAGHIDAPVRARIESSYYQMPSGSDLVSLAVRDAWNDDVVRNWGYDAEFPEPMRFFMRAQGWDWGRSFTGNDGVQYPSIHWPQLLWRAHWRPFPLGSAYEAHNRFRPERLWRYARRFPGMQPFGRDLLENVIKVADYPPKARTWLAALASPVLPIVYVRMLFRYGIRDREWARQQLLDRGYVEDDTQAQLDLLERWEDIRDQQALRNRARSLVTQTANEILAGYRDGYIDQATATARLDDLGWTPEMEARALALEDSRALRETLRQTLQALRRGYLAGTIAEPELTAILLSARVTPTRAAQYLARWQAQRSLQRRILATGQVGSAVAAGALAPADGLARLANLGWVGGDAALLIAQAAGRAERAAQHARDLALRKEQSQRKALESAARQAAAAVRQAQSRLRSITPIATLKRWYQLGLRSVQWVRNRLTAQGYDRDSTDTYLSQWAMEEAPPLAEGTPGIAGLQRLLKRQTPLGTLKRWWQRGVATDSWTRRRLNDAGYTEETIHGLISEWRKTLPRGVSGPAPEGSGPPGGSGGGTGP